MDILYMGSQFEEKHSQYVEEKAKGSVAEWRINGDGYDLEREAHFAPPLSAMGAVCSLQDEVGRISIMHVEKAEMARF